MVGFYNRYNVGGAAINDSNTSVPTLIVSCGPTPTPAVNLILIKAFTPIQASTLVPTSAPSLLGKYTNKNLQKTTKFALKSIVKGQEYSQLQKNSTTYKQSLKIWLFNLYYRNLHLDCYCFCQESENHIKIARANRLNQIFFVNLFFRKIIV